MPFGIYGYIAAGLLAMSMVGGIYHAGYSAAERKGELASTRAELEIAHRDLAVADAANEHARQQLAAMSAAADRNDQRIKDLAHDLEKAPLTGACALGSYARRLRDIR